MSQDRSPAKKLDFYPLVAVVEAETLILQRLRRGYTLVEQLSR